MRTRLGHGLSPHPQHLESLLEHTREVGWLEVLSDQFLGGQGGARLQLVERLRRDVPVALHGLSLSIGSADPLDTHYLTDLAALIERLEPCLVSDHLSWSSFGGRQVRDLYPLPYTEETLAHVVERVRRVQDFLGRRILLENPSSYLTYADSTLGEHEFLAAVAEQADCAILLDVNNLHVCASNHGWDARAYLDALPRGRVEEIHLAGHEREGEILVDTHLGPVPPPVWELYRLAVARFGPVPSMLEWDTGVPGLEVLLEECRRAARVAQETGDEARRAAGAVPLAG